MSGQVLAGEADRPPDAQARELASTRKLVHGGDGQAQELADLVGVEETILERQRSLGRGEG